MGPQIHRRPVPSRPELIQNSTLHHLPAPAITSLRYARSVTDLRENPGDFLYTAGAACHEKNTHLPVGFVVDEPPPYSTSTTTTTTLSDADALEPARRQIRHVKSSTAISALSELQNETLASSTGDNNNKWKAALGEAQYYAGGLVSRPVESTRHFSIIRHSHALVWYRGPLTCVPITVLSDVDIPAERTVWLQQKGYSGNIGMSVKALVGSKADCFNVTPTTKAGPEALPEVEERGIQRDLKRFERKTSGRARTHVPKETLVIRIPATAADGYFRLVVCGGSECGKKILCGSPVFRIASVSTNASVTRGASLTTLPLELGVKVASTVGQRIVQGYAGAATMVVQNKISTGVAKVVSSKALSQIKQMAGTGVESYKNASSLNVSSNGENRGLGGDGDFPTLSGGLDGGPEKPFPMTVEGTVMMSSGLSTLELGIPTANISGIPADIKLQMKGVFAAWARITPTATTMNNSIHNHQDVSSDWHETIVTIGPLRYAPRGVVIKNKVTAHIIHDFDGATFFGARIRIVLMGYLHAPVVETMSPSEVTRKHNDDMMTVLAGLGRDGWTIESVLAREDKSLVERIDGATGAVQRRVDSIPLHRVGIRSDSSKMRDEYYGIGGLWIPR